MRPLLLGIAAVAVTAGVSFHAAGQGARPAKRQPVATVSFREDIVPILKGRCMDCHQPGGQGYEASGLDLRSYEGLMKGTKFGPMVIKGDPQSSSLMALLDWRVNPQIRMPHGAKKLSTCDRDAFRHWIAEGAQDN